MRKPDSFAIRKRCRGRNTIARDYAVGPLLRRRMRRRGGIGGTYAFDPCRTLGRGPFHRMMCWMPAYWGAMDS